MADDKKTTEKGRLNSSMPNLQTDNPIIKALEKGEAAYYKKLLAGKKLLDYNYAQEEIRWMQDMEELGGPQASGKTTFGLIYARKVLEAGGCVAMLDSEQSIDPKILERLGVEKKNDS